ncbi:histidine phosphatase family protein [Helicobacter muridarum]|uniref:Histidine phosphatase family protein n=1 Tax=Helicobacter muridarum TaxID=216 RepID=A0A377PU00_9HELI|nr:histidine phosphatase family protein [Helicobacter muridarum]TLE00444.1 histidine phosphatase family protein [Helicobacter muridarum]STQ86418.1 Histidine phosphatase superfamily (branch 1) [Helicobacter muridarum]
MIFSIYEDFVKSANMTPKNAKLILRHSLRGDIRKGETGLNTLLTREGKVLAKHFGQHCKFNIERIFSSYIQRCVETANCFLQGYDKTHNKNLDIITTDILADCYIDDIKKAGKLFKNKNVQYIMSSFLRGETLPGMKDIHSTMNILLNFIFQNECENMEIFVTHDTFLLAIICFCYGITEYNYDEIWPYMLEGAFIYYDSNRGSIECIFRGIQRGRKFTLQRNLHAGR